MIIESVHVKSYRSVFDEVLECEMLTALVGANGSGKSTFLRALDLFYSPSPKVDLEDFYNRDTSAEIVVAITFKDLSAEAKTFFSSYLQGQRLTVERVLKLQDGKLEARYHGSSLQCPEFQKIRAGFEIKDRGKTAKDAYESVRANADFSSLSAWTNLGAVATSLKEWEASHPDKCTRQRDDGQFFGFKEVGQGYLGRFTKFLFIPAVRDAASDAAEGRGSVFSDLMDLVVRSVLANKEAIKKLKEDTQKNYENILDPTRLTELTGLSADMTKTLKLFVPDSSVELLWLPLEEVNIPLPKADVKLVEDGFKASVVRTGHGLQRAFILTVLQHLAFAQTLGTQISEKTDGTETSALVKSLPHLVLAIEEPELYQHPSRQRHLAKILLQLSSGRTPGVAETTQIIYGTHSPLFVGIDRIEQIRLLRKSANGNGKPKVTRVIRTRLDEVAESIWLADGSPGVKYSGATLLPRLFSIMTPWMSEGFYADVAVLVEGEDDRAAILGTASFMGKDLESSGFSVIPCGGKTSLDRPATIFSKLGIPIYLLWDGDQGVKDAKPQDNHRLLRLLGEPVTDWPNFIGARCACFAQNLEATLRLEIGPEDFDKWVSESQAEFTISKRAFALKNPMVVASVLKKAHEQGKESKSLRTICEKIVALKCK